MTKKDYVLIAKAILYATTDGRNDRNTLYRVQDSLAVYLKNENPLFDRDKFDKGWGLTED